MKSYTGVLSSRKIRCGLLHFHRGLIGAALFAALPLTAVDYTWNGGTGNWTDPTQWTPLGVPGAGDTASISSGTVTVSGTITVDSATLSGGSLDGTATLNATSINWTGTTLAAGAAITVNQATLNNTNFGEASTMSNSGTVTITGNGVDFDNSSADGGLAFTNPAGSTLELNGLYSYTAINNSWGAGTLINAGTLRLAGVSGYGYANIDAPLANTGLVDVQAGQLNLNGGGSIGGEFATASGTTLYFNGGIWTVGAATLSGDGTKYFNSGSFTIDGSTALTGTGSGTLNLTGGTVTGTGSLENVPIVWTGTQLGKGSDITLNNSTFNGASFYGLDDNGATLRNSGTMLITGNAIDLNPQAYPYGVALINQAGATLELNGLYSYQAINNSYGAGTLNNAGTLRLAGVSGYGYANIDAPLANTGLVDVVAGQLNLNAGGSIGGEFAAAAGTTLYFNGGNWTVGAATLSGDGTKYFNSGIFTIDGSTALTHSGGILNLTGGYISGTGSLAGPVINWTGTQLADGSDVTVDHATFNGISFNGTTNGMTIHNTGTSAVTGNGMDLHQNGNPYGVAFWNDAGAVLELRDLYSYNTINNSYGSGSFNNAGTLRLVNVSGYGYASITVPVMNTGLVEVQAGQFNMDAGGTAAGQYDVAAGVSLYFNGGTLNIGAATISGDGTKYFNNGAFALNGGSALTVTGSALNLTGGGFTGTGSIAGAPVIWTGTQLAEGADVTVGDATFNGIAFYNMINNGATIRNSGSSTITGNALDLDGDWNPFGVMLINQAGATLEVRDLNAYNAMANTGGQGALQNDGTLRVVNQNSAFGVVDFNVPITNTGTIDLQNGYTRMWGAMTNSGTINIADSGRLDLLGGGTYTGSLGLNMGSGSSIYFSGTTLFDTVNYSVPDTASMYFSGGALRFEDATLAGNGVKDLNGATLLLDASTKLATSGSSIDFTGGSVSGTGSLEGAAIHWQSTQLAEGSDVTVDNASFDGVTFYSQVNAGSTIHNTGASAIIGNAMDLDGDGNPFGVTLVNNAGATLEVRDLNTSGAIWNSGGQGVLQNAGTLRVVNQNSGYGVVDFYVPVTNTGAIDLQNGYTRIYGLMTNSGTINIADSGRLDLSGGGTYTGNLGLTMGSGSSIYFSGTTLFDTVNYSVADTASMYFSGGALRFEDATLAGNGVKNLNGATLLLDASTKLATTGSAIQFTGGSVSGTGSLEGAAIHWTWTQLAEGSDVTVDNASFDGVTFYNQVNAGSTIHNTGASAITGNAMDLDGDGNPFGVTLVNNAGATLEVRDLNTIYAIGNSGGQGVLQNAGTLRVVNQNSGYGVVDFYVPVTNTGAIDLQNGYTRIYGLMTNSGTINIADSGRLDLSGGGTYTGSLGLNMGSGSSIYFSGTTLFDTVNYSVPDTASMYFSGGALRFEDATLAGNGVKDLNGATLLLDASTKLATSGSSIDFTGGSVSGTGSLEGAAIHWTWTQLAEGSDVTVDNASFDGVTFYNQVNAGSTIHNTGASAIIGNAMDLDGDGNPFGVTLVNNAGATLEVRDLNTYYAIYNSGGQGVLQNAGTLRVVNQNSGWGYVDFYVPITNTGTIDIQNGSTRFYGVTDNSGTINIADACRLDLAGGGTYTGNLGINLGAGSSVYFTGGANLFDTVNYTVPATATMGFTGGTLRLEGVTLAGAGAKQLDGARLYLDGNTDVTVTGVAMQFISGIVDGIGSLEGAFIQWANTQIAEGSVVTIDNVTFTGSTFYSFVNAGATIRNTGTSTITGNGVNLDGDGNPYGLTFINQAGATLEVRDLNNNAAIWNDGGMGLLQNEGTLRIVNQNTDYGIVEFFAPVQNSGTVQTQNDFTRFQGAVTNSGLFDISSGGRLDFWAGMANSLGTITGATGSQLRLNGTVSGFRAGSVSNDVTWVVDGEVLTFTDASVFSNPVDLHYGTVNADSGLTLSGNVRWIGDWAPLYGTGVISLTGTTDTELNGHAYLARAIENSGTFNHYNNSSNYWLQMGDGSSLVNLAGGTFNATVQEWWQFGIGDWDGNKTNRSFTNAGTFNKEGLGVYQIDVLFNNTGRVNVNAGTFLLSYDCTQVDGTTLTGGTWYVGPSSTLQFLETNSFTTNDAHVILDGNTANITGWADLVSNTGTLELWGSRDLTQTTFSNSGSFVLQGGTIGVDNFTNAASGVLSGYGNVTYRPVNHGTIQASGGTLVFGSGIQGGSGTVQIDPGATLDLSGGTTDSTADYLIHNGTTAGSLNLGANNFVVSVDYTNASTGIGNSYNPRANVAGTGEIRADGNTAQAITGNVTNGTASTVNLNNFGNIHEGDSVSRVFAIANTGTVGASLRGALQTAAGTGNVTDARLSGSGVTAGNFGPVATGTGTSSYTVTFSGTSAGALASGQTVGIVNNFDNVADQTIQVGTGAVYRLASASTLAPASSNLGNVHEGEALSRTYSVTNTAGDTGGYTETLGGAGSSQTGDATASGNFTGLAWNGVPENSLGVSLDTTTAGAKSGTATFAFNSDEIGGSGLGTTALADQMVTVTGTVYRLASATVLPASSNLGNVHEGGALSRTYSVTNTAGNTGGYTETLSGRPSSQTGDAVYSGSFSGLAWDSPANSSLGVSLDTTTAGAKSGTATFSFNSDEIGGSGLGATPLADQAVDVTGAVYRLASASALPASSNLGNVHEGGALSRTYSVTNTAGDTGGYTETLSGGGSSQTGDATASGSFSGLAWNSPANSSLGVSLDTTTAGAKSGTATFAFNSDEIGGSGLGTTALSNQTVNATGNVYRLASGSVQGSTAVDFGIVHVGDVVSRNVSILNGAGATGGFTETLGGTAASGHAAISTTSTFSGVQAGNPASQGTVSLALDTSSNGLVFGTAATVGLVSEEVGGSGLGNTTLSPVDLTFTAQVNDYAVMLVAKTSPEGVLAWTDATHATLDLGAINMNLGGVIPGVTFNLSNGTTGYADTLDAAVSNTDANWSVAALGPLTGLNAGQGNDVLLSFVSPLATGSYSTSVIFTGTGFNLDGYSGALPDITVVVNAEVIPEPATTAFLAGLGVLALAAFRRRRS